MADDASSALNHKSRRPAKHEVDPEILSIAVTASAIALAALTSAVKAAESGELSVGSHVIAVIAAARDEERNRYRALYAAGRKLPGIPSSEDQVTASLETQSSLFQ